MENKVLKLEKAALKNLPESCSRGHTEAELLALVDRYLGGEEGVRAVYERSVAIEDLYLNATFLEHSPLRIMITASVLLALHELGIRKMNSDFMPTWSNL